MSDNTGGAGPLHIGDTVRVYIKIIEGDSERLQPFEGTLIRRKGSGINENITVRKISYGVGVERIFPLASPYLERLEVRHSAKVRRAKLYYLRKLSGRAAKMAAIEEPIVPEPNSRTPEATET